MQKQEQKIRANKQIRVPQVKVVNSDGEFLGVMDTYAALKLAQEQGLDLVEINPKIYPPLTKITDFGKYKYLEKKRAGEMKKNQKVEETKELFFHLTTDIGDLERLIKRGREFLQEGDKVRFVIKFRGREMAFQSSGEEKLKRILDDLKDVGSNNMPISFESRNMAVLISPNKTQ